MNRTQMGLVNRNNSQSINQLAFQVNRVSTKRRIDKFDRKI